MWKSGVRNLWVEYSANPCIHGVRFLASRRLSFLERTIWLSALLWAAGNIVLRVWSDYLFYSSYPMQVVQSAAQIPLNDFDFPAVTVCSVFKIKYDRAEAHVLRTLGPNATSEEVSSYWNTLIALALLHFPHFDFPWEFYRTHNFTVYPLDNAKLPAIFKEISHKVEDVFENCYWRGKKYNCSEMFLTQPTEEGFCLSFNSLTSEGNSSEIKSKNNSFYERDTEGRIIPLRNTAAGKHTGLELQLKPPDIKFYYDFQQYSSGYNVIIHHTWDLPDITLNLQVHEHPVKVQRIYVNPGRYFAADSMKDVPKKVRGCNWYPDFTNSLASDRNYCFIACRLNATVEACRCYPYYSQAPPGAEYCDMKHLKCLYDLEAKLRNHESNDANAFIVNTEEVLICNCMRPCNYVYYVTERTESIINLPQISNLYAVVDVSYKERTGRGLIREVKFTFRDFAVSVGGFASLFLGFSVISALEICYYLSRLAVLLCRSLSATQEERIQKRKVFVQPTPSLPHHYLP